MKRKRKLAWKIRHATSPKILFIRSAWQYLVITPAFRKLRQVDQELEASLRYIARLCHQKKSIIHQ
jgi:hypothetical protein